MTMFNIGAVFPPVAHRQRIRNYRENKKLFLGNHYDVLKSNDRLSRSQRDLLYISINLPGIISKKSADFLFGESPTYTAGKADDAPEQKAIERLVKSNGLNTMGYKSALGNAYRGDAFIKIRWGQKYAGALPATADPYRAFIENQNAEYVFPETMPNDSTQIFAYHIAIPSEVEYDRRKEWVISVESHYPGVIQYAKYRANATGTEYDGTPNEWKIYAEVEDGRRTVETGVPMPLIVHVPNYQTDDDVYGIDDLSEHKAIFDEINNRLSRIANVLDTHSDPALVVPGGTLGEDEYGNTFVVGRDKVFEVNGKEDVVPQYVTWNGQLTSAFEELKMLIKLLLINAEIPEIALGSGDSGTSGSSGLAIKFRMNSLLAKINRKRQFYNAGLTNALVIAQLLEHAQSIRKPGYEVTEPVIMWRDGLPDDEAEQANIYAIRTGGKATVSQKTALMKLDGLTEHQADAELKRMEDEANVEAARNAKANAANPSIFG